jgi:transcriptional regulator with XRE-family HTH domain
MGEEENTIQRQLGRRCRTLRKRRGLSQLDIVRHYDFTLSHYQKIERGVLDPRLTTLKKLAEALGVTMSALLRGVE